jgi:hypothetical protein
MMVRKLAGLTGLACLLALAVPAPFAQAAPKKAAYSIKVVAGAAAPKEVQEPIRKLLDDRCVQLLDARGTVVAEVWLRKEVPVKATEAQIKNGLTYREVPTSAVVGALRVPRQLFDYRKQKLPAGTYTLRLASQPMDGDHMGTAPYAEFVLASPAADDKKPDLMEAKALQEMSAKATEGHPAVLLLFPGTGAGAEPKLANKGSGHWVLLVELGAAAGPRKAKLLLGLTLIGASSSA